MWPGGPEGLREPRTGRQGRRGWVLFAILLCVAPAQVGGPPGTSCPLALLCSREGRPQEASLGPLTSCSGPAEPMGALGGRMRWAVPSWAPTPPAREEPPPERWMVNSSPLMCPELCPHPLGSDPAEGPLLCVGLLTGTMGRLPSALSRPAGDTALGESSGAGLTSQPSSG